MEIIEFQYRPDKLVMSQLRSIFLDAKKAQTLYKKCILYPAFFLLQFVSVIYKYTFLQNSTKRITDNKKSWNGIIFIIAFHLNTRFLLEPFSSVFLKITICKISYPEKGLTVHINIDRCGDRASQVSIGRLAGQTRPEKRPVDVSEGNFIPHSSVTQDMVRFVN